MQLKNFSGTISLLIPKIKNPQMRLMASRTLPHFCKIVSQKDLLNKTLLDQKALSDFQLAFIEATSKTAGILGLLIYFTLLLSKITIKIIGYQKYEDFGLKGETLKSAKSGELTLEKLLRLQPEVLFPYLNQ